MTPGTPRNGAVTVLGGKTTENNGKRPTKGFLKTNGSKERRGERTDIEYHCYGTCIIGLHTGCSDPRNRTALIVRELSVLIRLSSAFRYLRICHPTSIHIGHFAGRILRFTLLDLIRSSFYRMCIL